jgi:hypothetical protein
VEGIERLSHRLIGPNDTRKECGEGRKMHGVSFTFDIFFYPLHLPPFSIFPPLSLLFSILSLLPLYSPSISPLLFSHLFLLYPIFSPSCSFPLLLPFSSLFQIIDLHNTLMEFHFHGYQLSLKSPPFSLLYITVYNGIECLSGIQLNWYPLLPYYSLLFSIISINV